MNEAMDLTGMEKVSSLFYTCNQSTSNTLMDTTDYWGYHHNYYPNWYPSYHICERSKVEQAFKVVGKLLENKVIKGDMNVSRFIKLVNDIAEVL